MPNAKVLEQKKAQVASLVEKIKNSPAGVVVDYKGINVADDTALRKELRENGVEYAVVKNTMLKFAAQEVGFDGMIEHLNGTTAIAIASEDVVAPAKILAKFFVAFALYCSEKSNSTFRPSLFQESITINSSSPPLDIN